MALYRATDILGGIVGGLPPLVPFAGWRTYSVTNVYTDPEGIEFPVFRIAKTSGPVTDTISQIAQRCAGYFIEKKWAMGQGLFTGSFPGLAWYLLDPATLAFVAGPLMPVSNLVLGNLDQNTRDLTPITSHYLQWFEHSTPTGPYIAVQVARAPTPELPLWVTGHPVTIAMDLLTRKGEVYDSASAIACRKAVGPELGVLLPVTTTDESPQDVIDGFSEGFGFQVRHGESGAVEFVHWREKLGNISGLPVLDRNSIRSEGGPTFDLADSSRVTRVKVTGQVITKWQPGIVMKPEFHQRKLFGIAFGPARTTWKPSLAFADTDKPASGLLINSGEIVFDYSTDGVTPDADIYGEQVLEIELNGMPGFIGGTDGATYTTNLELFAEGIARKAFDAHARGRQMLTAVGIRGTAFDSALLGEAVTVDFDHLPNAQLGQTPTSQRGGLRPFRVIERTEQMPGPVVTMADEGTGVQFATVPSLVVWTDPFEPDLLLVSVSDAATLAAAGAQVEFQVRVYAFGDPIDVTDPGASYTVKDSTLWTDDPQVLRLGPFPLFHTVLLRVRAWLYGGDASDWSPWTGLGGVVTGPQTTLSDLVVNSTSDEGAVISWSYDESPQVGDVLVQYRLHGGGGYTLFSTLPPGTETETIDGLAADTWYDVRVVLDSGGEYGDVLLGSFTTLVGAISSLTLGTPTSDGVALSWTNTHTTAQVRIELKLDTDSVYAHVIDLPVGSTNYTLTGLVAETAYDVRVVLVSGGGEIGTALLDSFTTDLVANQGTVPTPTDAQVESNGLGTYRLHVRAVTPPTTQTIVFEEAVETAVGSGTPGSYAEVAQMPAVIGSRTTYAASAPNDGKLRYLRAYATATGWTDSGTTAPLAVDPWGTTTAPEVDLYLTQLRDVDAPSPADGDALVWNDANDQWEPSATSGYSDEQAQDAVGAMIADTATVNLTYTDATPELKADVIDDSITFTKTQNIATNRILGRVTASSGDIEELTAAQVLALLGSAPSPGSGLPYMYPYADAIDWDGNDNFREGDGAGGMDTSGTRNGGTGQAWTADNLSTSAVVIADGRLSFKSPSSASILLRGYYQPVPSGNYCVRMNVSARPNQNVAGQRNCGLYLRDSTAGKLESFGIAYSDTGATHLWAGKWTTSGSYSATRLFTAFGINALPHFIEIEYDGTNYYYRWGWYDQPLSRFTTFAKTDFLAAAADGIGVFSENDQSTPNELISRGFYLVPDSVTQ